MLRAVGSYDPSPGDGREHSAEVTLATDGDPATAWSTERYGASLEVIGKRGIGLVLDAGAARGLRQLVVQTDTPGFTAQVLAGDAAGGPFEPVAEERVVGARAVFDLGTGAKHRYFVVWITRLTSDSARLNEVTAG